MHGTKPNLRADAAGAKLANCLQQFIIIIVLLLYPGVASCSYQDKMSTDVSVYDEERFQNAIADVRADSVDTKW